MTRRFWRARYDRNFYAVYHEPPPPQPEDVQAIGEKGDPHPFRYLSNNREGGRLAADLPYPFGGGLLMNLRAAEVLLPLISSWTNIQSDVQVDRQPSHILAIVTQVYDAMNESTSVGRRGARSSIWLDVEELHLSDAKIGPSPIFRVPNAGLQWNHILSEEIVDAVRKNELTGLMLQEAVVE